MPEEYTNRELGILLEDLKDHILEVKSEVQYTNGDVRRLKLWRSFLLGAWAAIVFILPVMYLLFTNTLDNYNRSIDSRISQAIEQYDKDNFKQ